MGGVEYAQQLKRAACVPAGVCKTLLKLKVNKTHTKDREQVQLHNDP